MIAIESGDKGEKIIRKLILLIEETDSIAPVLFRLIHRHIGVFESLFGA